METPYFLINKQELDLNVTKLKNALSKFWSNSIVGYSYKTNSLPWIIEYFKNQNCFAEVVSDDEYSLAKQICCDKSKIIYNGPIKTKETFIEALQNGCIVNIDSQREIEWLKSLDKNPSFSIGLRVNFDLEDVCPGQTACGSEGGRFGFCLENGEFEKALKKVNSYGFEVTGIHLHTSSKTRSVEIYKAIAQVAVKIKKLYNLNLKFVDIGGGFFGGLDNKPQFNDYLQAVSEIMKQAFDADETTLIVEPGMSLIGSPISYVTSVTDVKDTVRNRFVITDGSRINIDPLMRKSSYFYSCDFASESNSVLKKQVICGFTCMENDRFFVAENCNELKVGDKIIFNKVGAYTMCLSPLFIKYFPPVYLDDNGKKVLLRKRWTVAEYIAGSDIGEN